jgi:hypothetical protein
VGGLLGERCFEGLPRGARGDALACRGHPYMFKRYHNKVKIKLFEVTTRIFSKSNKFKILNLELIQRQVCSALIAGIGLSDHINHPKIYAIYLTFVKTGGGLFSWVIRIGKSCVCSSRQLPMSLTQFKRLHHFNCKQY